MAYIFGTGGKPGSFKAFGIDLTEKSSVTLVTPRGDGSAFSDNGVWCNAINIQAMENSFVLPCFNESAYLYTFGHDAVQSNFSISFLCASETCQGTGQQIPTMLKLYGASRASKNPEPCKLIMHGAVLASGHMNAASVGVANVELKLYTVSFACNMLIYELGFGK